MHELDNRKKYLTQTSSGLQRLIEFHTQGLHVYRELESMGLGLSKLRILSNAISEIARELGITEHAAAEKLFRKIEKMNGVKLRQLDDDQSTPVDSRSVSTTISERVNLYFGPENE